MSRGCSSRTCHGTRRPQRPLGLPLPAASSREARVSMALPSGGGCPTFERVGSRVRSLPARRASTGTAEERARRGPASTRLPSGHPVTTRSAADVVEASRPRMVVSRQTEDEVVTRRPSERVGSRTYRRWRRRAADGDTPAPWRSPALGQRDPHEREQGRKHETSLEHQTRRKPGRFRQSVRVAVHVESPAASVALVTKPTTT